MCRNKICSSKSRYVDLQKDDNNIEYKYETEKQRLNKSIGEVTSPTIGFS